MEIKLIEFRPNSALLNPNFDGYKLSLSPIPKITETFITGVLRTFPNEGKFSEPYVKLFSLHNNLIGDYYNEDPYVYFVDQHRHIQQVSNFLNVIKVWEIPRNEQGLSGDYFPSLKFVSPELAVVSDGISMIYLLNTGNRDHNEEEWKCMFSHLVCDETPIIIQDAVFHDNEVHCLLSTIRETKGYKVCSVLQFLSFKKLEDKTWDLVATRKLHCKGDIHYAALQESAASLYTISDFGLKFIKDSEKPFRKNASFVNNLQYLWIQNDESIILDFKIEEDLKKEDFAVTTTDLKIKIKFKNNAWLEKDLYNHVVANSTYHSIDNSILRIYLYKKEKEESWSQVFKEENVNIAEEPTEASLKQINNSVGSFFNAQQVEECDFNDGDVIFERICVNSHLVTSRAAVDRSHVLFSTICSETKSRVVFIRCDIDACLFKPAEEADNSFKLKHIGTLPAFGYIQASKEQRKYFVCAPDLSYSVISEATRHLFIYKPETAVDSALRNRVTGRNVKTIGQQYVVTLPSEIIGIYAANKDLFLLYDNSISVLHLSAL